MSFWTLWVAVYKKKVHTSCRWRGRGRRKKKKIKYKGARLPRLLHFYSSSDSDSKYTSSRVPSTRAQVYSILLLLLLFSPASSHITIYSYIEKKVALWGNEEFDQTITTSPGLNPPSPALLFSSLIPSFILPECERIVPTRLLFFPTQVFWVLRCLKCQIPLFSSSSSFEVLWISTSNSVQQNHKSKPPKCSASYGNVWRISSPLVKAGTWMNMVKRYTGGFLGRNWRIRSE